MPGRKRSGMNGKSRIFSDTAWKSQVQIRRLKLDVLRVALSGRNVKKQRR